MVNKDREKPECRRPVSPERQLLCVLGQYDMEVKHVKLLCKATLYLRLAGEKDLSNQVADVVNRIHHCATLSKDRAIDFAVRAL